MARLPTPENLATIRVLYRRDDCMSLYGIPYDMRPGQQPRDLLPRFREDWVYLGGAGWFGMMTAEQRALTEAFLAPLKAAGVIPGGPHEWDRVSLEP